MEEGIIVFLVFHSHPLTNIHLVHRDFYHYFLINLFVITRLIADETFEKFAFYFLQEIGRGITKSIFTVLK